MIKLYQRHFTHIKTIHSVLVRHGEVEESWVTGTMPLVVNAAAWVGCGETTILNTISPAFTLVGEWETMQAYQDWTLEEDSVRR